MRTSYAIVIIYDFFNWESPKDIAEGIFFINSLSSTPKTNYIYFINILGLK
jgi:hypothetical protein